MTFHFCARPRCRSTSSTRPPGPWRGARLILAGLALAACASGGLSGGIPTLAIWPLGGRGADAIGSWRSELLSGSGTDWARKALCRPDGGCTFFGSTKGSFGPGTAFIAVGEIPDLSPQWARTYGGGGTDELDGAVATTDGGFVMFGSSDSGYAAGGAGAMAAGVTFVGGRGFWGAASVGAHWGDAGMAGAGA